MNKKKIIALSVAAIILISLTLLFKQREAPKLSAGGVKIVASIYPLSEIARAVGGTFVNVQTLAPSGMEPHDYEPTAQDAAVLQTAKLVLINGAGMEPWIEKLKPSLEQQNIKIINMANNVPIVDLIADSRGAIDPHIWLNPKIFKKEIEFVRDALISIDGLHTNEYKANAEAYGAAIDKLDSQITGALSACASNEIITAHNAFEYLALRYSLTAYSIAGLSPDEEPTPRALAELTKLARKNKIKYVFTEPLINEKLARTLAAEANIQVLTLNPIEVLTAEEINRGATYSSIMQDNINNLRTALSCK